MAQRQLSNLAMATTRPTQSNIAQANNRLNMWNNTRSLTTTRRELPSPPRRNQQRLQRPPNPSHRHPSQQQHNNNRPQYQQRRPPGFIPYGTSFCNIQTRIPYPESFPLTRYVRSAVVSENDDENDNSMGKLDTGFSVVFLGTGGAIPGRHRNPPSTALRLGGQAFLFDAGEGLQKHFDFVSFAFSDVTRVFITHMHLDHVGGIVGLLLQIQLQTNASISDKKGKQKAYQLNTVEVYGPPGLYHFIGSNFALTHCKLNMRIIVHELMDSKAQKENDNFNKNNQRRRINYTEPDHFYKNLEQRCLYPCTNTEDDNEQYYTIATPDTSLAHRMNNHRERQFAIHAVEIRHVAAVPTFAYVVEEAKPAPPIDPNRAVAQGVYPGKKYRALKNGVAVESDVEPGRMVQPEDVLLLEESKPGRKFVLLGDNCGLVGRSLTRLGRGCDVLVNEATLTAANVTEARNRGHSTAEMSGRLAKHMEAKVLVLYHLSKVSNTCTMLDRIKGASDACRGVVNHVIPAFDFMELVLPQGGFGFLNKEKNSNNTNDGDEK